MNIKTRDRAVLLAKKFIEAAELIPVITGENSGMNKWLETGTKLSATTKRVSMELTRALAEMRKPC